MQLAVLVLFRPIQSLSRNRTYADFLSAATLIDLYLNQPEPPVVLDLTGGQPDLVPEWILWMMCELRARGLERKVYVWSDTISAMITSGVFSPRRTVNSLRRTPTTVGCAASKAQCHLVFI